MIKARSGVASVKGLPLFGSLFPIRKDALAFFSSTLQEHGDRVRLRLPGRSILLLTNPEDFEFVLSRDRGCFGRSVELENLRPIFGRGLLTSDGASWKRQRKMIQPGFQQEAMRAYCRTIFATIKKQTSTWRVGQVLDVHAEMLRFSGNCICRILFGEQYQSDDALGEAVSAIFSDLRSEVLYLSVWRHLPTERSRHWNMAVAYVSRRIREIIQERRRQYPQGDLLSTLLSARDSEGRGFSDEEIYDEISTLFLAGHETSALSITWAAYLLASSPEAQKALQDEARALWNGELDPEGYGKSLNIGAAVKEALRLYPPVWSLGRVVTRRTMLGGETLHPGTDIWMCVHRTHRDARWFEEPESFRPDRWLQNRVPPPYSYLPFGMGPRVCIGQHLATAEAVLSLAVILSRFRLTSLNSQPVEPSAWISLRPSRPIVVRLEPL